MVEQDDGYLLTLMIEGAYPHPDSEVRKEFVKVLKENTKEEAAAHFCAFFIALFHIVGSRLELRNPSEPNLARWWYGYLQETPPSKEAPGPSRSNKSTVVDRLIESDKEISKPSEREEKSKEPTSLKPSTPSKSNNSHNSQTQRLKRKEDMRQGIYQEACSMKSHFFEGMKTAVNQIGRQVKSVFEVA